ncbi:serine/threonine-protein kinase pim-1-like [Pimephales promelas]|uniref:serine/threonine-protein kinase pim-1-like n=1 Tax=Pimephales promelas TaxID=90988 RepID=UPI0019558247|nr:serine/threonine-protein kinase pim-1-like [Pimephales promelas]XP_039531939.1 serine/threonine-protein kinase pim-1-like [Pimephales promelas]
MSLKRKSPAEVCDAHRSTPSTSSTDAAEKHQPLEENEAPLRKRTRTDSFEKLPSLHHRDSGSSDQRNERSAEGQDSLPDGACALTLEDHGHMEHLSSGLEVVPPVDPQGQTPPAPVHHSPVQTPPGPVHHSPVQTPPAPVHHSPVQTPPAPVHHSPVQTPPGPVHHSPVQTPPGPVHHSPAPGHSVDVTTEDDILSRFEIGKMLGFGGFGSVYEGKRLEDGLEVAVKFVRKKEGMKYINIPHHATPVPLEIGLLTIVNTGPKVKEIIDLLDWQDQPDRYIMVLERPPHYIDGFDFWAHQEYIFNEETARTIMKQVTMAAQMCCARGVFHSDIKLENLLINPETLEIKLIDFGCGRLMQVISYEVFSGTHEYCPPEFSRTGMYHAKQATVWSLGMILFGMLCGHLPVSEEMEKINDETWSDPRLSNECCDLIRRLLQRDPRHRMGLEEMISHKWF